MNRWGRMGRNSSVSVSSAGPTARTFDVEELVDLAWNGEVRVPHFQRDFRWTWEDVRRLFDSIVRGYPIGSLLLWTRPAPAQEFTIGDLKLKGESSQTSLWVVDGQQRLTSLTNALHPDSANSRTFALAYDLVAGEFVRRPASEDPVVIPLPVLFDLKGLLGWFARYPSSAELFDLAAGIARNLRQYEVPAYLVQSSDPEVLQDIFDRMNNFGKRLTRAEVFSALNAGEEGSELGRYSFDSIAARIDEQTGFGIIDDNTVLAAVLARRGTDVRRDIRREFDGESEADKMAAYEQGEVALKRAVTFLQEDADVPHISFLAYRYLLVVLSRIFAFFPDPTPRHRQLLRRWYWRAALVGPEQFKGGTPNAARLLLGHVHADNLSESLAELLDVVKRSEIQLPNLDRFNTNEAATKIFLCSLWSRGPRDVRTGEQLTRAALSGAIADRSTARDAVMSIIPASVLPERLRSSAAARILLPGFELDSAELSSILMQPPLDMTPAQWRGLLDSHCVTDEASNALGRLDGDAFAEARLEALRRNLRDFVDRSVELDFEDTPPLVELVIEDEDLDDPQ